MSVRLFVSRDAASLAVGAEEVAQSLAAALRRRGIGFDLIRTGSRGLFWLEPLVEVETPAGRLGYGPLQPSDAEAVAVSILAGGAPHPSLLGLVDEIPYLKQQTRLVFARSGTIDPLDLAAYRREGGYRGLAKALALDPAAVLETVTQSGWRGRGGRDQVAHGCGGGRQSKIHCVQCR